MGHPLPLFNFFRLFRHTLQFLQQINVKKCPSSMWCQDSNSQPMEHESPPITTRPGLPPPWANFFGSVVVKECLKMICFISAKRNSWPNHAQIFILTGSRKKINWFCQTSQQHSNNVYNAAFPGILTEGCRFSIFQQTYYSHNAVKEHHFFTV